MGSASTSPDAQGRDRLAVLAFASRGEWDRWLEVEHATAAGVWLKMAKKDSGIASVDYAQALQVALCWGWIDGQRGRFDEHYFLTRFTPRKPKSRWSQRNCAIAAELIATGAMKPPGLAAVERAKADGRWDAAYPSQSNAPVPEDLQSALEANPAALAFFDTLDSINRYAFLYRLHHVSRPDARSARIALYVEQLARGERLHA